MNEVHRYKVVTMLSAAGATIGYDPHGPDIVMASAFDEATRLFLDAAERCVASERREKELQQRLTAADERWRELVSAVRSINRSPQYKVMAIDDDEPQYRQRKEWIDWVLGLCDAPAALGEIDLTPKRLAHAESVIEQQNNLIASLRAELVESYRVSAMPQAEPAQEDRETLIGYGRSSGLDEASTLCTRLAYAAYYPPGTRFKAFTPKAQKALGDLLIKAANEIASLPGGPYERFKARQAKKAQSAESR